MSFKLSNGVHLFIYFLQILRYFGRKVQLWDLSPWPGIKPGPQQWQNRILTISPPGNTQHLPILERHSVSHKLVPKCSRQCYSTIDKGDGHKKRCLLWMENITCQLCSQDRETIWMSISRWVDKENVVHIHNGILFSCKKEWNKVIYRYVDRHASY